MKKGDTIMYRTKKELAEEYRISLRTVDRILSDILRPRLGERYETDAEIYIGSRCRIDADAFHDAVVHRRELEIGLL